MNELAAGKNLRQQVVETVGEFSSPRQPVYLVGGAVRDRVLNRPAHDLDFVLPGETRSLARKVAARLNGALYVLDEERSTTRIVLETGPEPGERLLVDFAALRAADLEGDLRARDFTINAMAVDAARPDQLIDPTGGLADLREKVIRACSPESLRHDPVRVVRAVRQAVNFGFRIAPPTVSAMREAAPLMPLVSAERLRDELFRILDGMQVSLAIRLLDQVGALEHLLPELLQLKGVSQTAPHITDAWEHTLSLVQYLEQLLAPLVGQYQQETVSDLTVGSAVLWLGRFRQQFAEHFSQQLVPDRTLRSLLFLSALYHDIAKPQTRAIGEDGRVHFIDHPAAGADVAAHRGRVLALSTAEINRMETVVAEHMRVHFLADSLAREHPDDLLQAFPSRRAVYRYFKHTGEAGVDICLLSLADLRATYGAGLPQDAWQVELQVCRALLEGCWEKHDQVVSPPRFLTGTDIMHKFALQPGKMIGQLLEAIREAQAVGEIQDREAALTFARQWLQRGPMMNGSSEDEGEKS